MYNRLRGTDTKDRRFTNTEAGDVSDTHKLDTACSIHVTVNIDLQFQIDPN